MLRCPLRVAGVGSRESGVGRACVGCGARRGARLYSCQPCLSRSCLREALLTAGSLDVGEHSATHPTKGRLRAFIPPDEVFDTDASAVWPIASHSPHLYLLAAGALLSGTREKPPPTHTHLYPPPTRTRITVAARIPIHDPVISTNDRWLMVKEGTNPGFTSCRNASAFSVMRSAAK